MNERCEHSTGIRSQTSQPCPQPQPRPNTNAPRIAYPRHTYESHTHIHRYRPHGTQPNPSPTLHPGDRRTAARLTCVCMRHVCMYIHTYTHPTCLLHQGRAEQGTRAPTHPEVGRRTFQKNPTSTPLVVPPMRNKHACPGWRADGRAV